MCESARWVVGVRARACVGVSLRLVVVSHAVVADGKGEEADTEKARISMAFYQVHTLYHGGNGLMDGERGGRRRGGMVSVAGTAMGRE